MRLTVVALFVLAIAMSAQDHSIAEDEVAVRTADEQWAKAISTKSLEGTISAYENDAFTTGAAMSPARGRKEIRSMWAELFAQPDFSLTWKTEKVVISTSGSMATTTGTWKMSDRSGPYLAVWRKNAEGKWKLIIDSAWYWQKPE